MSPTADVTVLGCGLMGSAVSRALAASGSQVVVWNRTASRAHALAGERVRAVDDVAEAVASSPVVIPVLGDYDDVESVLAAADLQGRTVVNLTTGTAPQARALAENLAGRAAGYLDGAILAYPHQIGTPAGEVVVSGPEQVWDAVASIVTRLGEPTRLVAEDIAVANLLDTTIVGIYHFPALLGAIEAATYALHEGVPIDLLSHALGRGLSNVTALAKGYVDAIVTGDFGSPEAKLETYSAGATSYLQAVDASGVDLPVLRAVEATLRRGVEAGLGASDLSSLSTVLPRS